jgi:putative endonuclease
MFSSIEEAIGREKQLKKWKREWKDKLIVSFNPDWVDMFSEEL